jgi:hypothetical protein
MNRWATESILVRTQRVLWEVQPPQSRCRVSLLVQCANALSIRMHDLLWSLRCKLSQLFCFAFPFFFGAPEAVEAERRVQEWHLLVWRSRMSLVVIAKQSIAKF